jgi:heme exporter protein A
MLEARALTCERGGRLLFSELDLAVDHGQMIQLEGANGSGKTSLLRILCGLAQPLDGEIFWNGASTRKQRLEFLANVAYLSHYNAIKGELTPVENIDISRKLGVPAQHTSIDDALEQVGLIDFDDQPCNSLSAGQKRRVSLARLLATDSPLWILDEPFTSLDVDGVALVEDILRQHLDANGMAIVTTHHPMDMGSHQVIKLRLGT